MPALRYQLHFSHKRKTIGLQIKHGQLIVRAPNYLTEEQVEVFVHSKKSWIDKKLTLSKSVNENATSLFNYNDGERLFILGEECTFTLLSAVKPFNDFSLNKGEGIKISLSAKALIMVLPYEQYTATTQRTFIKQHLEQWLNTQLEAYVLSVLPTFEHQMQLYAQGTKFRIYKSRWGSCNSRKQLTFNGLLIMAPRYVIDYVIIHELSHLKYMNHSALFWQLVFKHCAKVNEAKHWLKKYQKHLHLPD